MRRAFTLIEMLIVIVIVIGLTALAIGLVAHDPGNRRIREAARQVNAHFQGAKARAAETGRPVAVVLEPDPNPIPNQPPIVRVLKYAETPTPYAGDTLTSRAVILSKNGAQAVVECASDSLDVVQVGDMLKFHFRGHEYEIVALDKPNRRMTVQANGQTTGTVVEQGGIGMPYQVLRRSADSIVSSSATDLELPESVVIDLTVSGPDTRAFPPTNGRSLIVTFSPTGEIMDFRVAGAVVPVNSPLFFMVGKREHVETGQNLADLETIWIGVNHQTGLVTSVENAGGTTLQSSRDFALKAQTLGGR